VGESAINRIIRNTALAAWPIVLVLGAGCDTQLVEGYVETQNGERLPGVVVTVEGTRFQAMSNARGEFRVRHNGEPLVLNYFKTGYAPAALESGGSPGRRYTAETVKLWRLPVSHGVWLNENFRYVRARPVEPESYTLTDGRSVHGIQRLSDVDTKAEIPFIVIFGRLPAYNIALSRLEIAEARVEDLPDQTQMIWTPIRDIPVSPRSLDQPEGRLIHVRMFEPLEPGHYAVHWGALRQPRAPDPRAYLFNVVGDAPLEPVEAVPAEGEPETPADAEAEEEPPPDEEDEDIPDEAPPDE
jgi:hypothetical protein